MTDRPRHAAMEQFPVRDGQLLVGGKGVVSLLQGQIATPLYLYDKGAITGRVASLRSRLPDTVKLHYAVKANPMPELVSHMCRICDGLDVASCGELQLSLDAGAIGERISFAGPGKRDSELRTAIEAGVIISLESPSEMERTARIGSELEITPRVAVRVNPAFELRASGMKMGGGAKPFGIDEERVPEILERLALLPLSFKGFQIFSGSQCLNAAAIIEAHDRTFDLAFRLAEDAPGPVEWLNIGGGLGIPYFPGEARLDPAAILTNLSRHAEKCKDALPDADIVLELGRYLVGEAGIYICRIIDRKISRGRIFLVTDGGMHHHLAASGNLGQVIRKNYPVVPLAKMDIEPCEEVTIVGPLCTPLDILADRVPMPRLQPGDLIGVLQSGAYGRSASPIGFLGHPLPDEIFV